MIIKKGKFDIGSDSSVLIPQVQLGDVYERKRENLSDSHIKMTVDGTENDFGIRFLCERDGWHRFEVLKLEEFLTLLSEGKMYKIR